MTPQVSRGKFADPIDPKHVRYEWFVRGFSCETLDDPPGKEWHWESHVVGQVAVVLSGALVVEFKDGPVTLVPGDEAFIPPGCWHRARNADAAARCTWAFGYDGAH